MATFESKGREEDQFQFPSGLVLDADGHSYVCDKIKF